MGGNDMAQFKTQISALEQAASNIANLTEQFREQADQTYQATQTLSGRSIRYLCGEYGNPARLVE